MREGGGVVNDLECGIFKLDSSSMFQLILMLVVGCSVDLSWWYSSVY